jgi:hypothetical protein
LLFVDKIVGKLDDGICLKLIKRIISYILPALTHVINFCISNSVAPEKWKHALVLLIPKTKNPSHFDDFHPICILPLFSKILEHLVIDQLDLFLEDNHLIYEYQSGFRK